MHFERRVWIYFRRSGQYNRRCAYVMVWMIRGPPTPRTLGGGHAELARVPWTTSPTLGGARAFWGCNCPYVEKRKRLGQSPEDKSTRALTIPSQAQHRPFGTTFARASYVMGIQHKGAFIRLLIRSQVPLNSTILLCPMGRNQPAGISESCCEARLPFYVDAAIWLKLFAGISFLHGNILQSYSFLGVSLHSCCQIRCLLRMAAPGSEI